jgi:large subunit ribosomal protein L35Ae
MMGIISHFRGSFRRKKGNQLVVILPGVDKRDKAQSYIGKTAVWTAPGKNKTQIKGKISAAHGNKGALRVVFERGLPGQSLGQDVKIE